MSHRWEFSWINLLAKYRGLTRRGAIIIHMNLPYSITTSIQLYSTLCIINFHFASKQRLSSISNMYLHLKSYNTANFEFLAWVLHGVSFLCSIWFQKPEYLLFLNLFIHYLLGFPLHLPLKFTPLQLAKTSSTVRGRPKCKSRSGRTAAARSAWHAGQVAICHLNPWSAQSEGQGLGLDRLKGLTSRAARYKYMYIVYGWLYIHTYNMCI